MTEQNIINLLSKENIVKDMLGGSTFWWEQIEGDWQFRWAEHKNVYDEIFHCPNRVVLMKVYDRLFSNDEKEALKALEIGIFE